MCRGGRSIDPRCKWLISGVVAEISHLGICNFFLEFAFKYIGDSEKG
jgi:hypothetical protein